MRVEAQTPLTDTTMQDEPMDFQSLFIYGQREIFPDTTERLYIFPQIFRRYVVTIVPDDAIVSAIAAENLGLPGDMIALLPNRPEQWQHLEAEHELWRDDFSPIDEKNAWTTTSWRTFTDLSISPEAERRVLGYEHLMQHVYTIIQEEVQNQHISHRKLEVRPAWSHEYDENTGVVVDLEIDGGPKQRFALWERIDVRLQTLESSLSPNERDFLTHNLSLIVDRR